MEPRQQTANQLPRPVANGEVVAPVSPHEVVNGVGTNPEMQSIAIERQQAHQVESSAAALATPATLPAPIPQSLTNDDGTTIASDDSSPIAAADEELIEKEWVNKAKQIIGSTKDDPYKREQEIKRLQIDYVKKRYGRIIGDAESNDGAV